MGNRGIAAAVFALCAACGHANSSASVPAAEENARYNFRFRSPGSPWARVDPAHIDPGAALAYARAKPDISFLLYASRPGEVSGASASALTMVATSPPGARGDGVTSSRVR